MKTKKNTISMNYIRRYIGNNFTPFIMPNWKRVFKTRELQDVLPENNEGTHGNV